MPPTPLEDEQIAAATPAAKPIRLYDGGGLHLLIQPTGGRWWRFKYRFGGRHQTLSAGVYPDVGIEEARARRDEFRALLAQGVNPSDSVKAERARQREAEARRLHETRFAIENSGALVIRLGNRQVRLTVTETGELRRFLDATRAVAQR